MPNRHGRGLQFQLPTGTTASGAWIVAGVAAIVVMAIIYGATDALHFAYDDYELWLMDLTNDPFRALIAKYYRHYRIGAEIYNTFAANLTDFSRAGFHALALLWHGLAAALFAACLAVAFPHQRRTARAAAVLAFAMPLLTATTYIAFLDCARLAMVFTWLGLLLVLLWERKASSSPRLLILSMASLYAGFTVYENGIAFIALLPVLVGASRQSRGERWMPPTDRLRSAAVAVAALAAVVAVHRWVLNFADVGVSKYAGGASAWEMLTDQVRHLSEATVPGHADSVAVVAGAIAAAGAMVLLWAPSPASSSRRGVAVASMVALGAGMVALGILPFLLAGFMRAAGWEQGLRIHSSAAYGVAILLAVPMTLPGMGRAGGALVALVAALWTVQWAELRHPWVAAAKGHCRLWSSLFDAVPAVAEGTTIIVTGFPHWEGGVPVLSHPNNIRAFLQMAYRSAGDREQIVTFIVRDGVASRPWMVARHDGIVADDLPGLAPRRLDRLLIIHRDGTAFRVVPEMGGQYRSSVELLEGVELRTNPKVILPAAARPPLVEHSRLLGHGCKLVDAGRAPS
ncbi:MAG: hypothetical protein HY985_12645 [Magnetospirillum sp.]|nr:hypothetical protein [Magnetospirillum sp.]